MLYLNLLFPGLGFLLSGRIKWAVYAYSLYAFLVFLFIGIYINIDIRFINIIILAIFVITYYSLVIVFTRKKKSQLNIRKKWYLIIIYFLLVRFIIAPNIVTLINKYFYQTFEITSENMKPTLIPSDKVVSNNNIYIKTKPNRYDVIVYYSSDDNISYVSRIIGLPGETIEIKDNLIYINQELLKESYSVFDDDLLKTYIEYPKVIDQMKNFNIKKIPSEQYFIMGDNRYNSADSRFKGFIDEKDIFGKLEKIYWSNSIERIDLNLE